MRAVWVLSFSVFVWGAVQPSAAQEKISPSELIIKLGDRKYKEREIAQHHLLQLGEIARPQLEQAIRSPDFEIATRSNNILTVINQARDTREILLAPKVRFQFKDEPLYKVLNKIMEHTDGKLYHAYPYQPRNADLSKRITVDTGELPVFDAIQRVFDEVGISLSTTMDAESHAKWRFPLEPDKRGEGGSYSVTTPPAILIGARDGKPYTKALPNSINPIPTEVAWDKDQDALMLCIDALALPSVQCKKVSAITIDKAIGADGKPLQIIPHDKLKMKVDDDEPDRKSYDLLSVLYEEAYKLRTFHFACPSGKPSEIKLVEGTMTVDTVSPVRFRLTGSTTVGSTVDGGGYFLRVDEWKVDAANQDTIATLTLGTAYHNTEHDFHPINREGRFRPFLRIEKVSLPTVYHPSVEFVNTKGEKLSHKVISPARFTKVDSRFEGKCVMIIDSGDIAPKDIQIRVLGRVPTSIQIPFRFENLPVK